MQAMDKNTFSLLIVIFIFIFSEKLDRSAIENIRFYWDRI